MCERMSVSILHALTLFTENSIMFCGHGKRPDDVKDMLVDVDLAMEQTNSIKTW